MSSGTPKDQKLKLNMNNINNKTPSQKSLDEKEKIDKNNQQSLLSKKNMMPNFIERNDINEKNFPQKANYFNEKIRAKESPILEYFSPSFYFQKYHSPEEMFHSNKNLYSNNNLSNNNTIKSVEQNFKKSPMEQNFNFSPSNIFNNTKNLVQNSSSNKSLNNIRPPIDNSNEEEDNKTLQERIGILLGKNDTYNLSNNQKSNNVNNLNSYNSLNNANPISNIGFIGNNYFNNNNLMNNLNNNTNNNAINSNINNVQQNEEENENQEEVYILNFNSEDENDKDIDDDIPNNNLNNANNNQNSVNENNKKEKNNRIRNNIKEQLNNIINTGDNEFPSYGGGTNYQNQIINDNPNIEAMQQMQNFPISNNINNTTNNIFYPTMNNNIIYSPINFGYFPYGFYNNMNKNINNQNMIGMNNNDYYQNKIGQFMNQPLMPNNRYNNKNERNNKFLNMNSNTKTEKKINNFYYNGDQYQIGNNSNNKNRNKNKDENKFNINLNLDSKEKNIYTIGPKDLVTTITSNKKKIKRVNPKAYLNESYEYLSHNIFILAKDQAGCRFLQDKIEKDPITATNYFYEAIQPYVNILVKDPFGNYLVQKIIKNLNEIQIKKILEIISPSIVDISTNNHGTRVIQFLIIFLKTKELQNYFIQMIKPHTIHLLKELNGAHIIQKLLLEYPESCLELNKLIIENSSYLATHKHGCCVLQKFLDGNYKILQNELIQNLISNCLVLITDQFGNYVIQSVLMLKDPKINSEIAKKINDNIPYYSKHRYSSNVIEKCFDLCSEEDKKNFVEKLSSPEIIAELILDDHGNYVIQKVLQCADGNIKENILKNIIPIIPKIKEVSFGERLLNRLYSSYPQLNGNFNSKKKNNFGFYNESYNNEQENNYKNRKYKK